MEPTATTTPSILGVPQDQFVKLFIVLVIIGILGNLGAILIAQRLHR